MWDAALDTGSVEVSHHLTVVSTRTDSATSDAAIRTYEGVNNGYPKQERATKGGIHAGTWAVVFVT